ncbi:hypothetical protein H4R20_006095 [Coemansia guatemalensis]|uniref:Uncharacterized protein n=1 Tax=Coemansia guatemalensis TaxID=2761395 RepID=A0A9W8HRH4_9FUNG|nr:hypothetical protein H4R20_006095 [Coemansia guatemalensis]
MSDSPEVNAPTPAPAETDSDVAMHSEHSLVDMTPEQLSDIFRRAGEALRDSALDQYAELAARINPITNAATTAGETAEVEIPAVAVSAKTDAAPESSTTASQASSVTKDGVTLFKEGGTKFDGEDIVWSARAWIATVTEECKAFLPNAPPIVQLKLVMQMLAGKAKLLVAKKRISTLDALFEVLLLAFPQHDYDRRILQVLNNGSAFKDITPDMWGNHAWDVFRSMDQTDTNAQAVASALRARNQFAYAPTKIHPNHVTAANIESVCKVFNNESLMLTVDSRTAGAYMAGTNQGGGNGNGRNRGQSRNEGAAKASGQLQANAHAGQRTPATNANSNRQTALN